ncbi:hypothetical protein MVEN_01656200 [Mycena venus]|uniref:DUF6535 domain-containing protein n=1 Tax=Mycena venus TaxID=2733690 RepID=A0A8H7CQW8_9AGAR|nr:hypothetical protein MVEN_01656200 [Mycena venus]
MNDRNQNIDQNFKATEPGDEAAAAKLWAVYVLEAEKYDKALVESWKSDMEGLLIFAGLFSAILTAFLIESYKTLNSNSGDLTVQLLTQISEQLLASATGDPLRIPTSIPFTPPITALACNGLWFLSLGLSLACAMIATLLQQWARDFLHRADMRSAPIIRARIFSYLYYGLRRFRMHTMVEIIPLLLHASLGFFFCGLVAFLIPVHLAMAVLVGTLLMIIVAAYSVLTFLPLLYPDCPYHTPLSGACWQFLQTFKKISRCRRSPGNHTLLESGTVIDSPNPHRLNVVALESSLSLEETMVDVMSRNATKASKERSERDQKALIWTVKSLADEVELEPFVEAIPDLLWGRGGRRHTYADHILRLAQNPGVKLHDRIATLLDSCHTGILSVDAFQRRQITCYKALYAIASLSAYSQSGEEPALAVDFAHIYRRTTFAKRTHENSEIDRYMTSAKTMMFWSSYCAVKSRLVSLRENLLAFETRVITGAESDLSEFSVRLGEFSAATRDITAKFPELVGTSHSGGLSQLKQTVDELLFRVPYMILFNYLRDSASLASPPYRWDETRAAVCLNPSVLFSAFHWYLEDCLDAVISTQLPTLNTASDPRAVAWIETSLSRLLSFWRPDDSVSIPTSVIQLLNHRHSSPALKAVLLNGGKVELYLWCNFRATLSEGPAEWTVSRGLTASHDSLTALWRLAYLDLAPQPQDLESRLDLLCSLLGVISKMKPPFISISTSITALIKTQILNEITQSTIGAYGHPLAGLDHDIFQDDYEGKQFQLDMETLESENPHGMPPSLDSLDDMWEETRMNIVAEFLEHCTSNDLPYRAVETLEKITHGDKTPGDAAIPQPHQSRFANSIECVFAARVTDLLNQIVAFNCWNLYADTQEISELGQNPPNAASPWLDDAAARNKITDVFHNYARELAISMDWPHIQSRIEKVLQGIHLWHPNPEADAEDELIEKQADWEPAKSSVGSDEDPYD